MPIIQAVNHLFLWVLTPREPLLLFFCYGFCFFSPLEGRGLKIGDILKDDEVLTAFLLRDAELSESIVYQLVNAKIRLEQVQFGKAVASFLRHVDVYVSISSSLPSVSPTFSSRT